MHDLIIIGSLVALYYMYQKNKKKSTKLVNDKKSASEFASSLGPVYYITGAPDLAAPQDPNSLYDEKLELMRKMHVDEQSSAVGGPHGRDSFASKPTSLQVDTVRTEIRRERKMR